MKNPTSRRATFIVAEDNLQFLHDYAYTERISIKDALDIMLRRARYEFSQEYQRDGKSLIKHK